MYPANPFLGDVALYHKLRDAMVDIVVVILKFVGGEFYDLD